MKLLGLLSKRFHSLVINSFTFRYIYTRISIDSFISNSFQRMSTPSMKALVLHGPSDLRLDHVPKPRAGPGSVIVRVETAPLWDYLVC